LFYPDEDAARVTTPLSQDLASRIQGGSESALEELYRGMGRRLLGLAFRLTLNRADAEDVLHDVFVGLPGALRRYRETGSFEGWLCRLVVRTALMQRRGEGRRLTRDMAYAQERLAEPDGTAPWIGEAERLLRFLPPQLRDVVVLREIEGMSHREIANSLGISEAASRVRLVRGLERLRRILKEE
jgi:RNA polymerase sigma-70 factor, ECF subfamily